ncbi:MAG TPA: hypothetical protein VIL35_03685 [Vicinamibacterales bacterium]
MPMTHARRDPAAEPAQTGQGPSGAETAAAAPDTADLFHRLNNLLGIVLVNAELIEAKAPDDTTRSRASQVVASVLEALATTRTLRGRVEPGATGNSPANVLPQTKP